MYGAMVVSGSFCSDSSGANNDQLPPFVTPLASFFCSLWIRTLAMAIASSSRACPTSSGCILCKLTPHTKFTLATTHHTYHISEDPRTPVQHLHRSNFERRNSQRITYMARVLGWVTYILGERSAERFPDSLLIESDITSYHPYLSEV